MIIKFKKLTKTAQMPVKSTDGACGHDIFADAMEYTKTHVIIKTNIAVEIPEGYALFLIPRSSIYKTDLMLANSVGLIDSDYRGNITAIFKRNEVCKNSYKIGERIGQLILIENFNAKFVEVNELSETKRGEGGYGSTGK